jgi:serine phosphatase RsbU (regulator of sigma subunit)
VATTGGQYPPEPRALRAHLMDGDSPRTALEKCSRPFDVTTDGHIVSVLVGVGHRESGEITLASAGHPSPLLMVGGSAEFLSVPVGPPPGTGACTYASMTVPMSEGATLLSYTDGLVERRGEDLSTGMTRLASTVGRAHGRPLQTLVSDVLESMGDDRGTDDIAVLALRRTIR